MRASIRCGLLALLAATLAACSSGSSSPTCSFDDPASFPGTPAPSETPHPWQKFHYDQQNTGSMVNANLSSNPGTCRWVFPPGDTDSCATALSTPAQGAFAASPVISGDGKRIYIGSADGTLYALDAEHGMQITRFSFSIASSITSAALVAARTLEGEVVFVGASNGDLYGLTDSAAAQPTYWPSAVGGSISGSPNIGADGTVYVASLTGVVAGVCPNGIERFALSTSGTLYSPTQGPDGTLYFGGNDHLLRAVQPTGVTSWSFSAAGAISTAPAFDTETNSVYVADGSGRVFKVETNGRPDSSFAFGPVGPIASSPALAGDHLYFGSDDGNVYAIDKSSGDESPRQPFPTGGAVRSSPAVATNPGSPSMVVTGSDDGNVYFLQDNGTSVALMAVFSIGAPVRSSPAIGSDGTVYVGADDGRVYAIGAPLPPS
jgi:outer membrane protein assembly factor BamB